MVSNGTLEWSDTDAQPLEPWALQLDPSVAGCGAHFKMSVWRL